MTTVYVFLAAAGGAFAAECLMNWIGRRWERHERIQRRLKDAIR